MQRISHGIAAIAGATLLVASTAYGSEAEDRRNLALLDTKYQRAVKENDSKTMAAILANNFVVIGGDGKQWSKADLIKSATDGSTHYERQEDTEQSVRVFGNTGIVTAKLLVKGVESGEKVDYTLWFSDVYVRTSTGWEYVFGQCGEYVPAAESDQKLGSDNGPIPIRDASRPQTLSRSLRSTPVRVGFLVIQ
jgi:ketosteroid isomerase-like protein